MKRMHSYKMAFNLYLQNALREIKTQHTVRDPRKEEKGAGEGADGGADPSNKQMECAALSAKRARAGEEQ